LRDPLATVDSIGAVVCATGIVFEAVGDEQLRRFKLDRLGSVMYRGRRRYTRHPNYFGDFLVVRIGLVALRPAHGGRSPGRS
jgi:steroid 5-alpha reductase family enzyme